MRRVSMLISLTAVLAAGENGLVTTWRGHDYRGVMPARNLPVEFCWYDEDAPVIGEVGMWLVDPDKGGTSKTTLPHKPGTRLNACWRVTLPAWGHSNPVAVGDKVFVTCEAIPATNCQYVLVCVDIPGGKVDWVRPIDHLLAMPKAEAAKLAAIRKAEVEGWAETMRLWNRIYWDNERDTWFGTKGRNAWKDRLKGGRPGELTPERQRLLEQAAKDGYKMSPDGYWSKTGRYGHPERLQEYQRAFSSRAYIHCHNKDWPWYGSTCASPVGDGTAVYAVAAPDAVVCYELDGKLRWAADMQVGARPRGSWCANVHRNMTSPVYAGGKLVYFNTSARIVFAWDGATGKPVWKTIIPGDSGKESRVKWDYVDGEPRHYAGHMGPGGTPVPMTLKDGDGDVQVVVIPSGHTFRLDDGKFLGWFNTFPGDAQGGGCKGATYGTGAAVGDVYYSVHSTATRLAVVDGELQAERLWNHESKDKKPAHKSNISLIAADAGLVSSRGELWNLADGTTVASGLKMRGGHGYVSGCVSADGLLINRGRQIGNDAITFNLGGLRRQRGAPKGSHGLGLVAEGRHPDAVRQGFIDRFGMSRIHPGWAHPTAFGNRIFIRTNAYLYCFGTGNYVPPKGD